MKFVPWFAGLWATALLCLALDVAFAGQIHAAKNALQVAQSAARAGTNAAANMSVNGDAFDLNANMAHVAAQNYLATANMPGTVSVAGDTVTVHADTNYPTLMLSVIGIGSLQVEATASARLIGN